MTRPTHISIDPQALLHNIRQVKRLAPGKKIIAMVKANAYGCGIKNLAPLMESQVDAFGVACLEEALTLRKLGIKKDIILVQGVFDQEELLEASRLLLTLVIHQQQQVDWLLKHPLKPSVTIWVKVNSGMNRLGFNPSQLDTIFAYLQLCPWVNRGIGLMTHFACADDKNNPYNAHQIDIFHQINIKGISLRSAANSAAIYNFPEIHADAVRPGIMLYGVSPFADNNGQALGLQPVMSFLSAISAIHHYPAHSPIGYGGIWRSKKKSIIGVVPVGYGDGYPRSVSSKTYVWVNGYKVPVVGRISMDMITIDLTSCSECQIGDSVELWGKNIAVEEVAKSAGTIGYELICQVTNRAWGQR